MLSVIVVLLLLLLGLVETRSCSSWAQTYPTSEDKVLRGFAPLLRVHQGLDYSETNSGDDSLREVCYIWGNTLQ